MSREVTIGQLNAFGAQGGALDKYVTEFDFEKIAPGTYKVKPKQDLVDGEYAFYYGGASPQATYGFGAPGSPKVFDFGIQRPHLSQG
jgi:hypothetical protein